MGKLYLSQKTNKEYLMAILIAIGLAFFMGINAPDYEVLPTRIYAFEYSWAYDVIGSLCVWFVIAAVLLTGIFLEKNNIGLYSRFLSFISTNSLMLFLFHQLFFKFFVLPLRFLLTPFLGELENSLMISIMGIGLYLLIFYIFLINFRNHKAR